jgi:type IV fimbrial biogenesis protein FimT
MNFNAAHARSRQSGVTMVELIVTMTIAGILLAMGVSSYKYVTKANRASGEINALLGDMQFARYEAVKEGLPVTICPATSTTSTACNASTSWSANGWIVQSTVSGSTTVLRRQLPFSSFSSTDTLTTSATAANSAVVFNREGFATGGAVVTFTLHDALTTSSYTRCLILGVSGVMQTGLATASGASILGASCS